MSFRMKETDRAFFVLTIDDANRFLGRIYDICHEYGVPLCPAIIPWNLDNVYDDPKLLEWSRRYYDYSDRNGVRGEPQYWNPRYWPGDYTLEENLRNIDGFVRDKKFVVFAMHGSDDPESCECPEKFREIIRHIVSLTIDKAVITTWADVFDRFWGVSE